MPFVLEAAKLLVLFFVLFFFNSSEGLDLSL